MADDKETKTEKRKWVDAVTRMIELTQQGEMRWVPVEPYGISEKENRTSAVFRSSYKDKTLRIYEKQVQERQRALDDEGGLAALTLLRPKYQYVWVNQVVLEFIDGNGNALWTFPRVGALRDLLSAVQYQAAGVNEFIDDLFEEPSPA
jgi:hypothetical protein